MTLETLEPAIREHETSVGAVCPWLANPYALVSWWDMERFAAAGFMSISLSFEEIREEVRAQEDLDQTGKADQAADWHDLMQVIGEECLKVGLKISSACADDISVDLKKGVSSAKLLSALTELENTIRREMKANRFFYMPSKQAEFYDQKELFGTDVNTKFPSIQFDMVEAGNCYAMGRGTACVFHLMRVMEVGVQNFGTKLGVAFADAKNWQNILDETNKAIKDLPSKASDIVEMTQAAANLYAVKLAWRNEVMHPNDTYTLEEAENILRQVKLFMGQLASII